MNVYDFVDKEPGKAIPYGVYDIARNEGWVGVGVDHDTAQFAVATILGVAAGFTRPRTGDGNPHLESRFRTMTYRPLCPTRLPVSIEAARGWFAAFVAWYDGTHLHGSIRLVTPGDRHAGRDAGILGVGARAYPAAQRIHPDRPTGDVRDWSPSATLTPNPERTTVARAAPNETNAA